MPELAQFASAAQAGSDAYKKGDYAAAEAAFRTALAHGPQRGAALFYVAASAAHRDDTPAALAFLNRYAAMGMHTDLDAEPAFAILEPLPGYAALKARLAANAAPLCLCKTVFTGSRQPFIAEGLARDSGDGRLFVGGVHARRILVIVNGIASDFVTTLPQGYSPFGMVADDARKTLWVSAAAVAQGAGATNAQQGHSALLAFDLSSGALRATYPAPTDTKYALGDIALASDGAVYLTDSLQSALFALRAGGKSLERIGPVKSFSSAQGIAISKDGRTALIADYEMGLLLVDLNSGVSRPVSVSSDQTTIGIDGLVRFGDGSFIATQNGLKSPRIVRLRLSANWSKLTSLEVIAANAPQIADMSLVTADGAGGVYTVGGSQWASFDDGKPDAVRPLPAWSIVRLR
ncbi:MAG TPA: hypothetical protein VHW02_11810 [Rhizomicrobium sp.]|nr:hypothetical protein [Rhizomicrobium sp.]